MTQPTAFQDGDWFEVKRLLEFLLARVVDTGGQSVGIRFGSATLTWTGGSPFATGNVTHGLGRTPAVVLLCDNGGGSLGQLAVFAQNGVGATTFSAAAEPTDSSSPANGTTRGFNWLVIG